MNHDFLLPLYPIHSEAFLKLETVTDELTYKEHEVDRRAIRLLGLGR